MVDLLNVKKLIFLKILIFFGFSRRGQDKCVPSELNISYGCFLYAEKNLKLHFRDCFAPFDLSSILFPNITLFFFFLCSVVFSMRR